MTVSETINLVSVLKEDIYCNTQHRALPLSIYAAYVQTYIMIKFIYKCREQCVNIFLIMPKKLLRH